MPSHPAHCVVTSPRARARVRLFARSRRVKEFGNWRFIRVAIAIVRLVVRSVRTRVHGEEAFGSRLSIAPESTATTTVGVLEFRRDELCWR